MLRGWKGFRGRMEVAGTLLRFLWQERLWWMIPMVTVLLLLGLLLFMAASTPLGPFIYALF